MYIGRNASPIKFGRNCDQMISSLLEVRSRFPENENSSEFNSGDDGTMEGLTLLSGSKQAKTL